MIHGVLTDFCFADLVLSTLSPVAQSITPENPCVNAVIESSTVQREYQAGTNELTVLPPDDFSAKRQYKTVYMPPVNTGTTGHWRSSIFEVQKANLQNLYQMIFVAPAYGTQPFDLYHTKPPDDKVPDIYIQSFIGIAAGCPLLSRECSISLCRQPRSDQP